MFEDWTPAGFVRRWGTTVVLLLVLGTYVLADAAQPVRTVPDGLGLLWLEAALFVSGATSLDGAKSKRLIPLVVGVLGGLASAFFIAAWTVCF